MDYSSWLFLEFLLVIHVFKTVLADQNGFLSLSCGVTTSYTDDLNISWIPDDDYVTKGSKTYVKFTNGDSPYSAPLRFFPNSQKGRKCYRLPVRTISSSVLVRPQFYYKNYDGLGKPPMFSVSLGTAITATVNLTRADPWIEEFIWPVTKDTLLFCLHSIPGSGYPVISSLEVRPLPHGAYGGVTAKDDLNLARKLLRKCHRINCGCSNGPTRYPFDPYDRIWDDDEYYSPSHLATTYNNQLPLNLSGIREIPPLGVLQSARVLTRSNNLSYSFPLDKLGDYYIVLYFAGIFPVSPTFDILINGNVVSSNFTIKSWETSTLFFTQRSIRTLNITFKSVIFYPQVNAIEVYELIDIPPKSSSTTVSALQVIQQSTGSELGWEDDPCHPTPWNHIRCEGGLVVSLRLSDINLRSISPTFGDLLDLKTLDLHNTSLTGQIQNLDSLQKLEKLNLSCNQLTSFGSDFTTLSSLRALDLRNNNLRGSVPESLGKLKNLKLLNLENNKLGGALPKSLNRKNLEVRLSGNLCLSFSSSTCNARPQNSTIEPPQVTVFTKTKTNVHHLKAIIIGIAGGVFCVLLLVALFVFLYMRKKKRAEARYPKGETSDLRNWNSAKMLSYKEIKTATNNFKEVIGRGSFGTVYVGKFPEGKLVAVKVRFDKTQLGADSFINEVYLLSQIRHQNLVSLEGFCSEAKQQILVYEYLAGGSLSDNLYGSNSKKITLSWVRRLKIAVDAAKGLDYLHNGSNPRIIHRDVKCSNILLDTEMNAKVCDFGLSRQISQPDASHVTTVVKGTAGYLDPEYYTTQQLTEKSDVYSFGVVLLELICGREPLCHAGAPDSYNLVLWAKPYLQAGVFEIVDHGLEGNYDMESMRKTASVASRCVERDASQRPTIAEVLAELKEAYSIQLAFLAAVGYGS